LRWQLLAAGMAFSATGVLLAANEEYVLHIQFAVASLSDFAYFFFGVPVLLAISMPTRGFKSPIIVYLYWVEATFAGLLAYVAIFPSFPFPAVWTHPVSISLLTHTYNLENLVLTVACLIRFIASEKEGEERAFFRTLLIFLVTFSIGLGVYQRLADLTGGSQNFSLLADIPYILFAWLILRLPQFKEESHTDYADRPFLAVFVDFASPIFFTLALLALVLTVLPSHPHLGMAAIGVILGVYGVRTTLLQIRFMLSQNQLLKARDSLEQMTLQDGLTGIANRRCFDQTLELEWNRSMRSEHPLSLMLIDLDFFKSLNDTQGHPSGDRCLVEVAAALRSVISRSTDLVARYGGEEFAAILPATTTEAALRLAQQFQDALETIAIPNRTSLGAHLTASVGIATRNSDKANSAARLLEAADAALYRAKHTGRNRIEAELPEYITPLLPHPEPSAFVVTTPAVINAQIL